MTRRRDRIRRRMAQQRKLDTDKPILPEPLTPDQIEKLTRFRDEFRLRRDEERQWRAVWGLP